jgi:hypothetical protein
VRLRFRAELNSPAGSGEQAAVKEERVVEEDPTTEEDPMKDDFAASEERAAKAESLEEDSVGGDEPVVGAEPAAKNEHEVKETPAVQMLAVKTSCWAAPVEEAVMESEGIAAVRHASRGYAGKRAKMLPVELPLEREGWSWPGQYKNRWI